jgi:tetratricopeptide (TPR) repeat protein
MTPEPHGKRGSGWSSALAVEVPSGSAAAATVGRRAAVVVFLYTIAVLAIALLAHRTPLYFVETDLVGEYIPAAEALSRGTIDASHYSFKGPGYPLLLAIAGRACGGDWFLAARVVSALATGAAAAFAGLLVARFAGLWIALFTLAGLMLNPTFLRYGVEAGTDAPAAALMLGATWAIVTSRSPFRVALAGLLAGLSIVTRWNAAFLVPVGALLLLARPRRVGALVLYLAFALLPSVAWGGACLWSAGHLLPDRNYLNVAYELYGRDLPWDQFEHRIGARFHSLLDVLAYDPGHAAGRILWNLAVHFGRDLLDLVPVWLGVLVPPGIVLAARRPSWRPALLHAAACAVCLAPVFYSARFSLYLLPFLLAAAGVLLHAVIAACERRFPATARPRHVVAIAGVIALGASGVVMARDLAARLADSPDEARAAGEWLRGHGLSGQSLMCRKPHAAWFARMEYRPMPMVASIVDLHRRAREARARYLMFSPIEVTQRPELAVLGDSAVKLPGLDPLRYARVGKERFYAIYRVRDEAVDSLAMTHAIEDAVIRYADRHARDAAAQVFASMQLLDLGQPREAITRLLELVRGGAEDPAVSELLSNAYLEVDELEASRRECRLAMAMNRPTAWHYARLAEIAERQNDWKEAQTWYEHAVEKEPANLAYLERLGHAYIALARYRPAAAEFERCIRLAPEEPRFRRLAMGAYQFAGDAARARQIFDQGLRSGMAERALLQGETAPAASR